MVLFHSQWLVCLGCSNKMPQAGGLNNRRLFLTVPEAEES